MIRLDGRTLRWQDVVAVARQGEKAELADSARRNMETSRKVIEKHLAAGDVVYGVTTGFGKFSNVPIDHADRKKLQLNLLRSHAAGVGEPFGEDVVRAMLLLRAHTLAIGASGIRPVVAEKLLALLNARIHPVVPEIGKCLWISSA